MEHPVKNRSSETMSYITDWEASVDVSMDRVLSRFGTRYVYEAREREEKRTRGARVECVESGVAISAMHKVDETVRKILDMNRMGPTQALADGGNLWEARVCHGIRSRRIVQRRRLWV